MSKQSSESIYENLIESLEAGVICVDTELRITVFNQSAERQTELSRVQTIGNQLKDIFKLNQWLINILDSTLHTGKLFNEHSGEFKRRLGTTLPVSVGTNILTNKSGEVIGVAALIKDLSGIKSLEAEALRKDRLAYIGTFAANLAHEVRNPLGGIKGSAQLMSRRLKEDDRELRKFTDIITKESDRLNLIVNEMLDFAAPKILKKRALNIHKILDHVIELTVPDIEKDAKGSKIKIIRKYDPSLPPVAGDSNQLTQVFLNLIKNARESITEDGVISVATNMVTDFRLTTEEKGKTKLLAITIEDTGSGIREKDIEKVFTPFFTTKSKGSGLGMAISYKIIKEHDGFLHIESTSEKGTIMLVHLPLSEAPDKNREARHPND
jgi:two-component system nitrogen regulation sensor histidine kinase GlnL